MAAMAALFSPFFCFLITLHASICVAILTGTALIDPMSAPLFPLCIPYLVYRSFSPLFFNRLCCWKVVYSLGPYIERPSRYLTLSRVRVQGWSSQSFPWCIWLMRNFMHFQTASVEPKVGTLNIFSRDEICNGLNSSMTSILLTPLLNQTSCMQECWYNFVKIMPLMNSCSTI